MPEKVSIKLDRPTGIYFAGEEVTGKVKIEDTSQHVYQGISLELTGKAHAQWNRWVKEEKSIQKTDFVGEKFYFHSNRTLWGHLYQTPSIHVAGSDIVFGGAVEDGYIFIPCRKFEGSNRSEPMEVAIRVCDSLRNNHNDNLGELVIDAKALVQRNDVETFQLSLNGIPRKSTIKLSATFEKEKIICSHHDRYHHCSTLLSPEVLVLKVHSISGLCYDGGLKNASEDSIAHNIRVEAWRHKTSDPITKSENLLEPFLEKMLPSGTMKFSFSFQTSIEIPGSAVVQAGKMSGIFYYLSVIIRRGRKMKPGFKRGFSPFKNIYLLHMPIYILPLRHMPSLPLLVPQKWDAEPFSLIQNVTGWRRHRFAESDTIEIGMSTDRSAYAPGERIRMDNSQILNNSGDIVIVRAVLKQWTSLFVPDDTIKSCKRFILCKLKCHAYSEVSLRLVHLYMPAVFPSTFSQHRQDPVSITYSLALEVCTPVGIISEELPILVCPLPPSKKSIEKAIQLLKNNERICNKIELEELVLQDVRHEVPIYEEQKDNIVSAVGTMTREESIKISVNFSTNQSCIFTYDPKVLVATHTAGHIRTQALVEDHPEEEEKEETNSISHTGTCNYKYRKGFKFSLPFHMPIITNKTY